MGKKKGGRGGRSGRSNARDDTSRDDILTKSEMHNARFEAYYKAQNIIPEDEWDAWMNALREPLPTTFRVAGSRQVARELNHIIQTNYVPTMGNTVFEGEPVSAPVQIP
jgi:multisite-specific tRNA:(cytosine-C5)-methyltransferase